MYSEAALGHGSVLIEVLIETASSIHTTAHSHYIFLFAIYIFSNLITFKDMTKHLIFGWGRRIVAFTAIKANKEELQ